LQCTLNKTYSSNLEVTPALQSKVSLIDLNLESIKAEKQIANENNSYSKLLAIWLPVKGYYAVYHLLCLFEHLDSLNVSMLNNAHTKTIRNFTKLISAEELTFSNEYFNQAMTGDELKEISIQSGANLTLSTNGQEQHKQRYIQILKMTHRYKTEDLRRKYGGALRTKKARQERENLDQTNINIFELLYWYRIRANYKDLDIIEEDLADSYYTHYINSYCTFLFNYSNALKQLINQQLRQRGLSNTLQFTFV